MNDDQNNELIKFENISKNFNGVKALSKVSFSVQKNEIHGLIGENGAGKSTLIKICAGIYKQNYGDIFIDNKKIQFNNPNESEMEGIRVVHQDVSKSICNNLTVAENIFLGPVLETRAKFFVNRNKINEKAHKLLKTLGIELGPTLRVGEISPALQQLTLIAKAFHLKAKFIIMDEPTTALSQKEVGFLFKIMKKMRDDGMTFMFVSHRLNEVIGICDRITILRDGKYIDTLQNNGVSIQNLSNLMTGKSKMQKSFNDEKKLHHTQKKDIVLEVKNLSSKSLKLKNISFKLFKGEILSIAGLLGSGRTELLTALFGGHKYDGGDIYLSGKPYKVKSPKQAIDKGMGLIVEDRNSALFQNMNLNDNVSPVIIDKLALLGWIKRKEYVDLAKKYQNIFNINAPTVRTSITNLSGGNQQKIVISRWLAADTRILLCDEITKGVDVGTKIEIRRKILELANHGVSVIYVSSEFDELLEISDRVLIMSRGRLAKEINKEELKKLTPEDLNNEVNYYMGIDDKHRELAKTK